MCAVKINAIIGLIPHSLAAYDSHMSLEEPNNHQPEQQALKEGEIHLRRGLAENFPSATADCELILRTGKMRAVKFGNHGQPHVRQLKTA
jgi:hypothetical protein